MSAVQSMYPHDPDCTQCASGRGAGRSPRRSRAQRVLEVQVDIRFLGHAGQKVKLLVFRQMFSGLLDTCLVSENAATTSASIRAIMGQFGLGSGRAEEPIDFRTDAADDVRTWSGPI